MVTAMRTQTMSMGDAWVTNADGENVRVSGMKYNAAIDAIEVRAARTVDTGPALLDSIGAGPLSIYSRRDGEDRDGALRCVVYFASSVCPFHFECDPSDGVVREMVILRGLRLESKE